MQKSNVRNIIILVISIAIGFKAETFGQQPYPIPSMDDKLLFYFQRNYNKNTIIYELNTLPDGSINVDKPVVASWIRYEEGGVRKDLSFIQRKAFGLQGVLIDKIKESFVLNFNSYKKRNLYLLKIANKFKAFITINGELAELTKLFLQCENNALGIPLTIKFVEITGLSLKSGNLVVEKFKP